MKLNKIIFTISLLLAFGACEEYTHLESAVGSINKESKNIVWLEEFDGNTINDRYWSFEIGNKYNGWGNNELEYYTENNAEVKNGKLIITAKKEDKNGYNYTSSRMITAKKLNFTYGEIEVRAKLPKGKGIWPAIWMLGESIDTKGWPGCGEIDIMELIGDNPFKIYGTLHGPGYSGKDGYDRTYTLTGTKDFSDEFHVFKVDWQSERINWYVDDELYHTVNRHEVESKGLNWVFDNKFYILLNVAVGGSWPGSPDFSTEFPQTMEIDYIKISQ